MRPADDDLEQHRQPWVLLARAKHEKGYHEGVWKMSWSAVAPGCGIQSDVRNSAMM